MSPAPSPEEDNRPRRLPPRLVIAVNAAAIVDFAESKWPGQGHGDSVLSEHTYQRGLAIGFVRRLLRKHSFDELLSEVYDYLDDDRRAYTVPLDTWFGFTRRRWRYVDSHRRPPESWRRRFGEFVARRREQREAEARRKRRARAEAQRHEATWRAVSAGRFDPGRLPSSSAASVPPPPPETEAERRQREQTATMCAQIRQLLTAGE